MKRKKNTPVLGVCEYCSAEFAADPETTGRPQDAHACIQKQFIAHKCKPLNGSQNAVRIHSEECLQAGSEEQLLKEIRQAYSGKVVAGHDLDIY